MILFLALLAQFQHFDGWVIDSGYNWWFSTINWIINHLINFNCCVRTIGRDIGTDLMLLSSNCVPVVAKYKSSLVVTAYQYSPSDYIPGGDMHSLVPSYMISCLISICWFVKQITLISFVNFATSPLFIINSIISFKDNTVTVQNHKNHMK